MSPLKTLVAAFLNVEPHYGSYDCSALLSRRSSPAKRQTPRDSLPEGRCSCGCWGARRREAGDGDESSEEEEQGRSPRVNDGPLCSTPLCGRLQRFDLHVRRLKGFSPAAQRAACSAEAVATVASSPTKKGQSAAASASAVATIAACAAAEARSPLRLGMAASEGLRRSPSPRTPSKRRRTTNPIAEAAAATAAASPAKALLQGASRAERALAVDLFVAATWLLQDAAVQTRRFAEAVTLAAQVRQALVERSPLGVVQRLSRGLAAQKAEGLLGDVCQILRRAAAALLRLQMECVQQAVEKNPDNPRQAISSGCEAAALGLRLWKLPTKLNSVETASHDDRGGREPSQLPSNEGRLQKALLDAQFCAVFASAEFKRRSVSGRRRLPRLQLFLIEAGEWGLGLYGKTLEAIDALVRAACAATVEQLPKGPPNEALETAAVAAETAARLGILFANAGASHWATGTALEARRKRNAERRLLRAELDRLRAPSAEANSDARTPPTNLTTATTTTPSPMTKKSAVAAEGPLREVCDCQKCKDEKEAKNFGGCEWRSAVLSLLTPSLARLGVESLRCLVSAEAAVDACLLKNKEVAPRQPTVPAKPLAAFSLGKTRLQQSPFCKAQTSPSRREELGFPVSGNDGLCQSPFDSTRRHEALRLSSCASCAGQNSSLAARRNEGLLFRLKAGLCLAKSSAFLFGWELSDFNQSFAQMPSESSGSAAASPRGGLNLVETDSIGAVEDGRWCTDSWWEAAASRHPKSVATARAALQNFVSSLLTAESSWAPISPESSKALLKAASLLAAHGLSLAERKKEICFLKEAPAVVLPEDEDALAVALSPDAFAAALNAAATQNPKSLWGLCVSTEDALR